MFKITRNNVNDRISNRVDSVIGILGTDLIGHLLLRLRCLMHQTCFAMACANHSRMAAAGSKRYAYRPAELFAKPAPRLRWQAATTARGVRSAG